MAGVYPLEVLRLEQVAVPYDVGMAGQFSPPEVHHKKRKVVEDVGAGNLVVELDSVEQRRFPVEEHDVAQMKIAVTLTHETGRAPPFEYLRAAIELSIRGVSDASGRRRLQARSPELGESGSVSFDDPGHPRLASVIGAVLGGPVELGDRRRQGGHEFEVEMAKRRQAVEQGALWEPIHLHEPVDGRAVPAERVPSVVLASDGNHSSIERRRRPAVEPNFRLTERAAAFGR